MHRIRRMAAGLALSGLVAGPAIAQTPECVVIEDFSKASVGQLPEDWKLRKNEGKGVYGVREEGGLRFLRGVSQGLGIQAARAFDWDMAQYPVLAWSWRPQQFPQGADERRGGANDSALAVYVMVPHSKVRGPKAVKYIWSESVPVGERLSSNNGLTQVRVLRTGRDGMGQWQQERVNARDDFKAFFNEAQLPRPAGIAVLTDADDTRSTAAGDYANFRACRS
jgi:hypothetical protein